MFVHISPVKKSTLPAVIPESSESIVLSLAPFSANPKVFFEGVKKGETAVRILEIENPLKKHIHLYFTRIPPNERGAFFSWDEQTVPAGCSIHLEITWIPEVVGSWRDIITLEDGARIRKDVPITFNCIAAKERKAVSTRQKVRPMIKPKSPKKSLKLPTVLVTSPVRRFPPKKRTPSSSEKRRPLQANTLKMETCTRSVLKVRACDKENSFDLNESISPKTMEKLSNLSNTLLRTPCSINFLPGACSSEEKRKKNRCCPARANCSTETYLVGNITAETYVKGNTTAETYVKGNLSLETYDRDSIDNISVTVDKTPPQRVMSPIFDDNIKVRPTIFPKHSQVFIDPEKNRCLELMANESNEKRKSNQTYVIEKSETKTGITDWSKKGAVAKKLIVNLKPVKADTAFDVQTKRYEGTLVCNAWNIADPFMSLAPNEDPVWMQQQENRLKRWLNAILTPPDELISSETQQKLDVAKLWMECRSRDVDVPLTKEAISGQLSSYLMDSIRKDAKAMIEAPDIVKVLHKCASVVAERKLTIRDDKEIHVDVMLQKEVLALFLSYTPVWLRIGLETVFRLEIPLRSNSDLNGLIAFIRDHFFKDTRLLKKYKWVRAKEYMIEIKKHMLTKFLHFVYFVDHAKMNKLVPYNPCLFQVDSEYKMSRDVVLKFAAMTLHAVGDITKFLRLIGYTLKYQQTYIHEFNYGVNHLGVDLRDGVRLARVMEIILLRGDLMETLQVPAISRLRKIHNVKVVFSALKEAGYQIMNDVCERSIVDGHREKTLSFLWQIIYKFEGPMIIKAAITVQKWWNSLRIVVRRNKLRRIYDRRVQAAVVLQRTFRRKRLAGKLLLVARDLRLHKAATVIQATFRAYRARKLRFQVIRSATIALQRWFRAVLRMRQDRVRFLELKNAVVSIQVKLKATILMRSERTRFLELKNSAVSVQRHFRAMLLMRKELERFVKIKNAAIIIQRFYRACKAMKATLSQYLDTKKAAIILQRRYRATLLMRLERKTYMQQKKSAILIQRRLRATILMQEEHVRFIINKNAVIKIQRFYRAYKAMKAARFQYINLKNAAIAVQRRYRATLQMRKERGGFIKLRNATASIQMKLRATFQMRLDRAEFSKLKHSTIVIQRRYRATILMRSKRSWYLKQKHSAILIQRRLRATTLMQEEHVRFMIIKNAIVKIQCFYRAYKAMKAARFQYLNLRNAAIAVQRRYRATLQMRKERGGFIKLRNATARIQMKLRATFQMRLGRAEFSKLKHSTIVIQMRYRATILMRSERSWYLRQKNSAILIQRRLRATTLMQEEYVRFMIIKNAIVKIQCFYRAYQAMKAARFQYLTLKDAAIAVQRRYRATLQMRKERDGFIKLRNATVKLQMKLRATFQMRLDRVEFSKLKHNTIVIQRRYRANILMRSEHNWYLKQRNSAILIQRRFRATLLMLQEIERFIRTKNAVVKIERFYCACKAMKAAHSQYLNLKKAAILVQTRYRATLLMRLECSKYLKQKNSAILMQRRFRATLIMRQEFEQFVKTKKAIVKIQRSYRAYNAMKVAQSEYLKLKNAAIVLQTRYRAMLHMRKEREDFAKLRIATVKIQTKLRATLQMRPERKNFTNLKHFAIIIQRRYRATLSMRLERSRFMQQKNSAILMQRRFRATKLMKQEVDRFVKTVNAIVKMQRFYRAYKSMKAAQMHYLNLKNAAIVMQRCYRATMQMHRDRDDFLKLRDAAVKIQTVYRATRQMHLERSNLANLKHSAIVIQRRFRALRTMRIELTWFQLIKTSAVMIQKTFRMYSGRKQYQRLRDATVTVQRAYRARLLMVETRTRYLKQRQSIITIQKFCRIVLKMRAEKAQFVAIRNAVVTIQRRFRASSLMKTERIRFLQLKSSTIGVQRKYRANRIARQMQCSATIIQRYYKTWKARQRFCIMRRAVKTIETRYLSYRMMVQNRDEYLRRLEMLRCLQACAKGYLFRRYFEERKETLIEERKRKMGAIKIQAIWRGYAVRKGQTKKLKQIRERVRIATKEAVPKKRLCSIVNQATIMLASGKLTLMSSIKALEDLDYAIRTLPEICMRMSDVIAECVYEMLFSLARSQPEMEGMTVAVSIQISFAKCKATAPLVWIPEYVDKMITLMARTCDKEGQLFLHLSTLIWLLAQNDQHRTLILNFPNLQYRLVRMKALCDRRATMVSKGAYKGHSVFVPVNGSAQLPMLKADWGLKLKQPRCFVNAVHACQSLLKVFDISSK